VKSGGVRDPIYTNRRRKALGDADGDCPSSIWEGSDIWGVTGRGRGCAGTFRQVRERGPEVKGINIGETWDSIKGTSEKGPICKTDKNTTKEGRQKRKWGIARVYTLEFKEKWQGGDMQWHSSASRGDRDAKGEKGKRGTSQQIFKLPGQGEWFDKEPITPIERWRQIHK